jgi:hypothetical protein
MPTDIVGLEVRVFRDFSGLPDEVRESLRCAEKVDVEQGLAWFQNLIRNVFPNDPGVVLFGLYRDRDVLALLPLRIIVGERKITALGNFYTSLYQPYLSSELTVDELSFLLRRVLEEQPGVSTVTLSPININWAGYELFRSALQRSGLVTFKYFCFGNWFLEVSDGWKTYLAGRPGQTRSTIKRKSKEFASAGGILEFCWESDRLEYGLEAFSTVYAASWKVPEPFPGFMPGLIRALASSGSLRLGIASLNGFPIAAQLWIVASGKASIYKLAYHEEYHKYSAGTLLTARLMEYVIEVDQVKEVDYLIGDDPYKASWMTMRRERWGVVAYNPRTVKGFSLLLTEASGRLAKLAWIKLNLVFQRVKARFARSKLTGR